MSDWRQAKIGDRDVVICDAPDCSFAFYRNEDQSVWILVTTEAPGQLDQERPPVFWVDDGEHVDLADFKSFSLLAEQTLGGGRTYISDNKALMTRIWHGVNNDGMGVMPQLLSGKMLTVQVYTSTHEVKRYKIDLDEPEMFRSVLKL